MSASLVSIIVVVILIGIVVVQLGQLRLGAW